VKDTVGAGDAFMAGLMVGLTRGIDHHRVLEIACRLGAYVASHYGATPLLPPELTQSLR
jgi:fructokinase